MSYTPTVWATGDIVSSPKLNKIENAIAGLDSTATEVSADVDLLKSQINDLDEAIYATFPLGTVSGQIDLISDGADEIPVRNVEIDIPAVQDLHGQTYPYYANSGVSVNLIPDGTNPENGYVSGKYLLVDGTYGNSASAYVSEYFPVTAGADYTFSGNSSTADTVAFCWYDSNKEYISGVAAEQSLPKTVTAPANAAYARSSQYVLTSFAKLGLQLEAGTTATTVKPYSNPCPITGHTYAKLFRYGKNLYSKETYSTISGNYVRFHGVNSAATAASTKRARGLYMYAGVTYHFYVNVGVSKQWNITWTRAGDSADSHPVISNATRVYASVDWVPPATDYYCFWLYSSSGWSTFSMDGIVCSIEVGAAHTTDSPEPKRVYEFNWADDTGTVYGCTLDPKSGKLTVTHALYSITSDTAIRTSGTNNNGYYHAFYRPTSAGKAGTTAADTICNILKPQNPATADNFASANTATITSNGLDVLITATSAETSLAEYQSWLDRIGQIDVVYPLATPIVIQLTPQEVTTVLGNNTFFADGGNVSIIYRKDPTMYNEAKFAGLELMLTANRETSMVASKPYSEGDLIIVSGVLYKAIASIASGATFTPDTNISETTIAAELAAL